MHDCPCCGEAVYSNNQRELCSCCKEAGCTGNPYDACEVPSCCVCDTPSTFCTDGKWHPNCDCEEPNMREFRVTRPNQYSNPNCPGHNDKSARQGHYVNATTPTEAKSLVRARLGLDESEPLDVQDWKLTNAW